MINPNIKKQYPVIKMPNGHPISATMYNRNTSQGVVYTNNEEIINTELAANLSTTSTVVANINITHSIISDLSATSELTNATITKVISLQSSISTDNTVSANTLVSKLLASSVTSTGTLAAELTVMSGSAFDADAQAFFDRVTVAGGTLTTTEKTAVNTLVIGMKADGIWTKMKAIYPMVGGGAANPAAACAQNLKSSSFTGTFTSGWTFASTGVKGNGTSAYMDTALNSLTHLSQTNTSISVYVRNNSNAGNPYDIGNATGGVVINATYLITRYSSNLAYIGIADATYGTSIASTDSRGFWIGATNGSLTQTLYKNGSSIKSGTAGLSTMANNNLYLAAINNGTTSINLSDKEFAFCSIGDGLSGTNASNFYTRVQAFQTTLNRQINP